MQEVLSAHDFHFPYTDLHFPGMNSGERILFVTRESSIMLALRLLALAVVECVLLGVVLFLWMMGSALVALPFELLLVLVIAVMVVGTIGSWWIVTTFRKSVFIITSRRLTKIIHTTPFNWYQFSLGLDEIQDTGSYSSTFFEALFKLGYFVARSGAGAIKNFKIENVTFSQDLHNYVNKLLYTFKHHPDHMHEFRPFIPHLKGEQRAAFLRDYPQYRTEF